MPDCRVEPAAPSDPKFALLAEHLEVNVMWAFGLAVGLWCLCWRQEYFDGRLKRWTATALAWELRWPGDAAKLVDGMLKSEILVRESDGTLVAKNFSRRQGPLIKKLLADRGISEERTLARIPKGSPGAKGDNSAVKLLLDRMRECNITGSGAQKREHAQAWHAAGIAQKAEALIMGEGKNKDIFWLARALNGRPPSPADAGNDSLGKIREKFLGGTSK